MKWQEFHSEVVNVDTVRSLENRCLDQKINVRHRQKLKKRTQGNGVSCKELITVHTRVICRAVPAVWKGNMRKGPGSESSARRTPQRRMCPEFNMGRDNQVERESPQPTKSTKQVVRLQDVGDWTFWKVRPPPKHKQAQKTAGDPESLEPCYTRKR
jgi:hypothetical protein